MTSLLAVVTGANKGVGFGIVKGLMSSLNGGIILLTARDEERGKKAVDDAKKAVPNSKASVIFQQLDISDSVSIQCARDVISSTYGGIDILVNNAGFAYNVDSTVPFHVQAEDTVAINYTATKNVCRQFFPLLRPHARIVNVSSQSGLLTKISSNELQQRLLSDSLTMDDVDKIMHDFVTLSKDGSHISKGFPNSTYCVSKVGVTAMTRVLQREIDSDKSNNDIVVTSCCPGYVDTDMSSHKGHLTIEQGAETPVYLALLPQNWNGPKGKFFYQKREMDWLTGKSL